jgi:ankyrin repeat protein
VDFRGWTLLHYACQFASCSLVELLVRNPSDLKTPGNNRLTPFHCAARSPDAKMVDFFTANTDARSVLFVCESQGGTVLRDCHGRTPTHWAVIEGSLEWVKATRQDAHLGDKFGLTALHLAAIYGQKEILQFLLEVAGSKKDELCGERSASKNYSPLHHAAQEKRLSIVRLLVKAKADVTTANTEGQTPLDIALQSEDEELIREMQRRGDEETEPRSSKLWSDPDSGDASSDRTD